MNETYTIPIRTAFDAISARARVREFAREQGLDITGQARLSLAVYSLVTVANFEGDGELVVSLLDGSGRVGVAVTCVIPEDERERLASGAFENVRWLVDEFNVETLASGEVQLTLVQWSPERGEGR